MRVHLAYADQNEEFGRAFPLNGMDGTAVRRLTLSDWGDDWYLVELERTFEYKGTPHDCVLVRSRWLGKSLGGNAMTPVFILLLRDRTALDKSIAESKDFDQAAWGIATTLPDKLAKDPA
jgi:hypothetical protein